MCYDHKLEPLPNWLLEELRELVNPIRCLPALGIHEHCEHVTPEPTFQEVEF
jgi:hypothetical protein